MNWKIIAKYSLTLYVALILSGIPIGYLMAGIDPSGVNVPDWLIAYNYLAISIISLICFIFLANKLKDKLFKHGVIVVLIVSLLSLIIDFLVFSKVDYFIWMLDLVVLLISMVLVIGFSSLKKCRAVHEKPLKLKSHNKDTTK